MKTDISCTARSLFRKSLFFLFLLLLSGSPGFASTGIIVAKNSTAESIKGLIRVSSIQTIAGRDFISGGYMGHPVTLVRSPMGKVNNTITTQILIAKFSVNSVISISPAGAIQKKVNIGDIVLVDKVFQHDFGTVKPYGFIWGKAPDGKGWEEKGYSEHPDELQVEDLGKNKERKIFKGTVVSGDQLIASRIKKEWLHRKFKALAVDMSAAAISQTCFANGVPCKIVRVITDHADESARSDFENSLHPGVEKTDYQNLVKALLTSGP